MQMDCPSCGKSRAEIADSGGGTNEEIETTFNVPGSEQPIIQSKRQDIALDMAKTAFRKRDRDEELYEPEIEEGCDQPSQSANIRKVVASLVKGVFLQTIETSDSGPGSDFDIERHATLAKDSTFRKMVWGVMIDTSRQDFDSCLTDLKERCQFDARGMTYLAAETKAGTTVLIHKPEI